MPKAGGAGTRGELRTGFPFAISGCSGLPVKRSVKTSGFSTLTSLAFVTGCSSSDAERFQAIPVANRPLLPQSEDMMKEIRFPQDPLLPFQAGNVWQVADASVHINMVGKTLVHYKHYRGKSRGVPTSLASKPELQKYLTDNKAILAKQ
jgi:hypothetical protein